MEDVTKQPCLQSFPSDVQRTISGSNIADPYQENIYQSPNAQASEAEQFAKTLSPLAQIEPICPETTKSDARPGKNRDRDTVRDKMGAHIQTQKDFTSLPSKWQKNPQEMLT